MVELEDELAVVAIAATASRLVSVVSKDTSSIVFDSDRREVRFGCSL